MSGHQNNLKIEIVIHKPIKSLPVICNKNASYQQLFDHTSRRWWQNFDKNIKYPTFLSCFFNFIVWIIGYEWKKTFHIFSVFNTPCCMGPATSRCGLCEIDRVLLKIWRSFRTHTKCLTHVMFPSHTVWFIRRMTNRENLQFINFPVAILSCIEINKNNFFRVQFSYFISHDISSVNIIVAHNCSLLSFEKNVFRKIFAV